ncbi:unnamed protein product [Leptidea sinapis]|uniref:Uncharacterized protein n=1 Tax=Leptidea sinapis TaxID=189913 RepID=A0A5E4QI55_9NEOP|nr:unnamed protein product [Leptidea sinapis]
MYCTEISYQYQGTDCPETKSTFPPSTISLAGDHATQMKTCSAILAPHPDAVQFVPSASSFPGLTKVALAILTPSSFNFFDNFMTATSQSKLVFFPGLLYFSCTV